MGQLIELENSSTRSNRPGKHCLAAGLLLSLIAPYCLLSFSTFNPKLNSKKSLIESPHVKADFEYSLLKCRRLNLLPGPPSDFNQRTESDRFVEVSLLFPSQLRLRLQPNSSSFHRVQHLHLYVMLVFGLEIMMYLEEIYLLIKV